MNISEVTSKLESLKTQLNALSLEINESGGVKTKFNCSNSPEDVLEIDFCGSDTLWIACKDPDNGESVTIGFSKDGISELISSLKHLQDQMKD